VSVISSRDLSLAAYRNLAEFRHQIRKFLRYSEDAARAHGIEPQQHQLLLAIKGLPAGKLCTISELADRLQIRHHSAVELINRLAAIKAVLREESPGDRREVLIRLTPTGEKILHQLSLEHQTELRKTGPELMRALEAVLSGAGTEGRA
jgi:DNA-binding MarR family transcriptional regulator